MTYKILLIRGKHGDTVLKIMDQSLRADQANVLSVSVKQIFIT